MSSNTNNVGLQEMFDYLRDDVKQFRDESKEAFREIRDEQRRFTEALLAHTKDDRDNFASLDKRLQNIEVSEAVVGKTKDARFNRFVGYCGLAVAFIASVCAVLALLK
jgi:hypothetical protein